MYEDIYLDRNFARSELSNTLKRQIKEKEAFLGRKCRSIWSFTNPKGERFLFGSFCKNWDRLIVTIAYWSNHINRFISLS